MPTRAKPTLHNVLQTPSVAKRRLMGKSVEFVLASCAGTEGAARERDGFRAVSRRAVADSRGRPHRHCDPLTMGHERVRTGRGCASGQGAAPRNCRVQRSKQLGSVEQMRIRKR